MYTRGFLLTAVAAILAASLTAGCTIGLSQTVVGSGQTVTTEQDLSGFSKVEASSAFRVNITRSDKYSVEITVDEKVKPYLDVAVKGDTLHIGLKPGTALTGASGPLDAVVTMPALKGLALSGACNATIGGFKSQDRLDTELSGASKLNGEIEAGDIRMELSGASQTTLSGKGKKLDLEASGASQANLADLALADAAVNLSGASKATVNVSGNLSVDASGASSLQYTGDPTLGPVKTSGASSVQPK
jgi:hypothetical protein